MSLSERLRPEVEAAPWVIEEVKKLEEELDAAWMAVDLVKKENTQLIDALRKVQALTFSFVMNKDNAADILLIVKPIRDVIKQTLERNKL